MPIKTPDNILAWICALLFVCIVALLMYNNFGPRQDISRFLPLGLMEQVGFDKSSVKYVRSHADKIGHFVAGMALTLMLFIMIRPESKLAGIFSIKTLGVFFILSLGAAELGQTMFRNWSCGQGLFGASQCHIDNYCNTIRFSMADVAAGFMGCLPVLFALWFLELRPRERVSLNSLR